MKVLYDHQIFSFQKYGGISRYFCELMYHYEQTGACEFEIGAKLSNNAYLSKLKKHAITSFFPGISFKGQRRIMYQYNQLLTNRALKKPDITVVHPTYYDPYILRRTKKPFVLTCHDLINEKLGDKYGKLTDSAREYKEPLLAAAAAIIAVSQNTKQDIIEIYGIPENRIQVIHLASSLNLDLELNLKKVQLPAYYLLYVGNRGLYKNFLNYVKAIAPLLRQDKHLKLVCAGGGSFTKEEVSFIKDLKLEENILAYPIDDALLATLYRNAIGFVFPSLYEGFGIPVLEAFSCECPVLSSSRSSIPEVAGNAALYFDPTLQESMLETTRYFVESEDVRAQLVKAGRKRANYFSWEETADKTLTLYKSLT